jgi:hypothetical protein
MTTILPDTPVSPLRQKLIDDMNMRHFSMASRTENVATWTLLRSRM